MEDTLGLLQPRKGRHIVIDRSVCIASRLETGSLSEETLNDNQVHRGPNASYIAEKYDYERERLETFCALASEASLLRLRISAAPTRP